MRRLLPARYSILAAAAVAAALFVAFGVATAGTAGTPGAAATPGPARSRTAQLCGVPHGATRSVEIAVPDGGRRTALVHRPAGTARTPVPLVIALHGAYRSGAFMERYSGLSRLADRGGFAVAYPDASASTKHFWMLHPGRGPDDVRFISALLDAVLAGGCVDPARVSVVGVSNGGGLAALLGCEVSGRLAGIVAVAGGYGDLPECRPDHPLSVLEIHGTADAVVPYHAQRGDVLEWLGGWVRRDGCRAAPQRRTVADRVTRLDWRGCTSGTGVAHLAIEGGQHAWPGADPPDPGPRVSLSATEEAWRFLSVRRRVTPSPPARSARAAGHATARAPETP